MATADAALFLRQLARGMAAETWRDLSDRQLVEHYLARRDDSLFEAILHRHGPMVYRVCWRVLEQAQDVEDAFQATFLLLAQRLRTIRKRDSLASWLHGVAQRVSMKARARRAALHRHEMNARVAEKGVAEDASWRDLRAVLDEELEHLPEKWRLPLVLCYLEGQTQDEAAARAGWSKNTLRRRLEDARDALGRRLKRRGVLISGALAGVLVSECATSGAASAGLVSATVEAASACSAGQANLASLVPANVATLVEGVTTSMSATKLKMVMVVSVCAMTLSGLGVGFFGRQVPAAEPQQEKVQPPTAPDKKPPGKVGNNGEDVTPTTTAESRVNEEAILGWWALADPKEMRQGQILLGFETKNKLQITWTPPKEFPRTTIARWELAEDKGKKFLLIKGGVQDLVVPCKLSSKVLELDGGEFEFGKIRAEQNMRIQFKGTWERTKEFAPPQPPKGFSFVARLYQGDPLNPASAKLIDGVSGACVVRSGGWFRIRQENVKDIDGEQVVPGYLMRTDFEPGEGGKSRLRLTLEHTGLEEDGKQETLVRTSYKKYDLTVKDGETVQLRFGKTAPADVWLQLRVTEDK
ncbi:MAG TPA: RNA polymerase sigma factor [Gemmataceae bacterium]|jgi:RNA polymerase sigma factor (sigma-70 family)|nr:RNA polymerase sigma factor [Gemmataceae bacterium]